MRLPGACLAPPAQLLCRVKRKPRYAQSKIDTDLSFYGQWLEREGSVRSADKDICICADPQRNAATRANILAGERAMMDSVRRCEDGPCHGATSPYAEIKAQSVDVPEIGLRRSHRWSKAEVAASGMGR
jgi:hypothetical protein